MSNRKHWLNQTFETEDANNEKQNTFSGFQKCKSAIAWLLGFRILEGFLFFKQIGLMPCAWFYKGAKHCRLLANIVAWTNAFVCYTSQSLCLSFLSSSIFA